MTPKFIRLRGIGLFGMNGSVAGVVAFGCLFLSALGGARVVGNDGLMLLAAPIVTVMRRAVWIVTLMAAIMLAALTVYLKIQFDIANRDVRAFAFQIVDLDRTLRRVGPEGEPARGMLFRYAARTMKDVWPQSQPRLGPDDTHAGALFDALESTVIGVRLPEGAAREALREARGQLRDVGRARWTLDEQTGRSLSPWMLSILVVWFMVTFAALGMSTRRSRLGLGVVGVCAAVLGSAVFLAVEYADPYEGVIIVSSAPMRDALFTISD